MSDRNDELRKKLESQGLEEVRRLRDVERIYGERKLWIVDEWIASKERELLESHREEDLAIKKEDSSTQKKLANTAIVAAVIAGLGVLAVIIIR